MTKSHFQLIVHSSLPVLDFYSSDMEEKRKLFSYTQDFLTFLHHLINEDKGIRIKFALPPIYYEIMDQLEFKEQMTIYLREEDEIEANRVWSECEGNMILLLRNLLSKGKIEFLAAPATFVNLPYITTPAGIQQQVQVGISIIEDFFLVKPTGFWFPNGAFTPGLDLSLVTEGIKYSYIDAKTIQFADPTPVSAGQGPVLSPHGLLLFPYNSGLPDKQEMSMKQLELDRGYPSPCLSVSLSSLIGNLDSLLNALSESIQSNFITMTLDENLIKHYTEKAERVHICSSFQPRERNETIISDENISLWSESYFIENELMNLNHQVTTTFEKHLLHEMTKEWMYLQGVLSNIEESSSQAGKKHFKRYEELSAYFKKEGKDRLNYERTHLLSNISLIDSKIDLNDHHKPKLLVLTWEYPPHVVGGLARHVHGLSKGLYKLGYDIHIITARVDELSTYEEQEGIHIYRVNPLNEKDSDFLSWVGGLNVAIIEKAQELSMTNDYKVIHAHDWLVGAAAQVIKDELEVPLIATIHATEHGRNQGIHTELQKFIHNKERALVEFADSVIVCSPYMKEEVKEVFRLDERKVTIIPNGIDKESEKPETEWMNMKLPVDCNKRMIFSIGRMVKEKGFDTLIHAAKEMKDSHPEVYFIIAGKGPMLNEYRSLTSQLGLEGNIHFIGYVTDEERNYLFSTCDIAIFPSRYEPFGIVALESMLAGKPTIVSDVGGLKGIVQHQVTGLFMEPESVESVIEQVTFLLEHDECSKEIGQKGKKVIESLFDWNRIAEQTKRVFEETRLNSKI